MNWEELKEKGNVYFRSKDYTKAIELYNEAISKIII